MSFEDDDVGADVAREGTILARDLNGFFTFALMTTHRDVVVGPDVLQRTAAS